MPSRFNVEILVICLLILTNAQAARCQSAVWTSYMQKGEELQRAKNWAEAEKVWQLVIDELSLSKQERNPVLVTAHARLAISKQMQNKFDEAELEYQSASELAKSLGCERNYTLMFHDFANNEVSLKRYDLAEKHYRQALSLVEDVQGFSSIQLKVLSDLQGVFRLENKELEANALQTQIDSQRAIKSEIDDNPLFLYRRGIADLQNKKFDSAICLFDRAAKRDPRRPEYTLNLGIAHQNYAVSLAGHDDAEAESQYKTAISIFEKDNSKAQLADAFEGLLILYVSQKRYKESELLSTKLLHLRETIGDRSGYLKAYGLHKTIMKAENKNVVLPAEPRLVFMKGPSKTLGEDLTEYDRALRSEIQKKWIALAAKYPGTDETNGKQRGTLIEAYIGADGSLKASYVQPLSHEKDIDERAKEAVRSVFPFRKPPIVKDDIHKLRVYFSLNGVNQS